MKKIGWLLDANIDDEKKALILWIKHEGKTKGYTYRGFTPSIFVSTDLLREKDRRMEDIIGSILEHPKVTDAKVVYRFVSVYDDEKSPVLQVFTSPEAQQEVARDLEKLPGAIVFHADIDAVQQFFMASDMFAFGRVEFEAKDNETINVRCIDDREDPEYDLPELEEIDFEVFVDTDQIFPTMEDAIHHIEIYHRGKTIRIEEDEEEKTLHQFQRVIDEIDPDIIVSRGGDESLFRYLSLRAKSNGMNLVLSRDGTPLRVMQGKPQSFWQYNRIIPVFPRSM